jgi:hypothetical protein
MEVHMAKRFSRLLPAVLALMACGCNTGRHSAAGFRLPEGNIERGKAAFVAFGCNDCHEVTDQGVPRPRVKPPVPVVLGGPVEQELTDGYLATSIIQPSYKIGHYPAEASLRAEYRGCRFTRTA